MQLKRAVSGWNEEMQDEETAQRLQDTLTSSLTRGEETQTSLIEATSEDSCRSVVSQIEDE
jgi:hypothetical protein